MTLWVSDWQAESDLDNLHNSCDVSFIRFSLHQSSDKSNDRRLQNFLILLKFDFFDEVFYTLLKWFETFVFAISENSLNRSPVCWLFGSQTTLIYCLNSVLLKLLRSLMDFSVKDCFCVLFHFKWQISNLLSLCSFSDISTSFAC